jgi:hypothetical protein
MYLLHPHNMVNNSVGQVYNSHLILMWPAPVAHITDKFALLNVTAANNGYAADKSDLFY